MATKTFEELKQLAIQIRDEKTNKQNTATRVGTAMLEHINKLEQDYYDKEGTNTELQKRDNKLTELNGISKYIELSEDIVWSYLDGSKIESSDYIGSKVLINVIPNSDIYFSPIYDNNIDLIHIIKYDSSKKYLGYKSIVPKSEPLHPFKYTTEEEYYIAVDFRSKNRIGSDIQQRMLYYSYDFSDLNSLKGLVYNLKLDKNSLWNYTNGAKEYGGNQYNSSPDLIRVYEGRKYRFNRPVKFMLRYNDDKSYTKVYNSNVSEFTCDGTFEYITIDTLISESEYILLEDITYLSQLENEINKKWDTPSIFIDTTKELEFNLEGFYRSDNGNYDSDSGKRCVKLSVQPDTQYKFSYTSPQVIIAFFNDEEFIKGQIWGNYSGFTTPSNCNVVSIGILVENLQEGKTITGPLLPTSNDIVDKIVKIEDTISQISGVVHNKVKWTAIGDSITAGNSENTGESYATFAAKKYGSGVELQKLGYWGKTMETLRSAINEIDENCNVTTVNFGANDYSSNWDSLSVDDIINKTMEELGNTTFENLCWFCKKMKKDKPKVNVIVLTPIKRGGPAFTVSIDRQNKFVDMELELCKKLGIPVIDLHNNLPIDGQDSTYQFEETSGEKIQYVHPNDTGRNLIANYLVGTVNIPLMYDF